MLRFMLRFAAFLLPAAFPVENAAKMLR